MVREISPDIMFFAIWRKSAHVHANGYLCMRVNAFGHKARAEPERKTTEKQADGYLYMRMDAFGHKGTGRTKNNRKTSTNDLFVFILWCMSGRRKNRKLAGMREVTIEYHGVKYRGTKGCVGKNKYKEATSKHKHKQR